jgi:hypothetical protein
MNDKEIDFLIAATKNVGTSIIKLSEALSNFAKALCSSEMFKIAMGNIDAHNGKYCARKAYKKARFKRMYKRRYEKKEGQIKCGY